ncbi:FG-GAP repeat domain-containing protein [Paenarthrobacter sp. 2TAF44]|uniref:FG-GAP repeat domain-containing protein n=1 Tax=Paenarthrobacter sp. 2TAF44 TaxID=3233018 RepID=UPI003F9E0A29
MTNCSTRFSGRHLRILALVSTVMLASLLLHTPTAEAAPTGARSSAVKSYVWPPDPAFLSISAASTATVPVGGELRLNFTVARPATSVDFVMLDESGATESFMFWKLSPDAQPQLNGTAVRTVQASEATGKYTLRQASVRFADGSSATIDPRKYSGASSVTDDFPQATFSVSNPAIKLQPNVNLTPAYIEGPPETGIWAKANLGTWKGGVSHADYQWMLDGVDLEYKSYDYYLSSFAVGSMVSFRAKVYSPGFLPTMVVSKSAGPVIQPRRPKVLGEGAVGSILRTDFSLSEVSIPPGASPIVKYRWVGPPYAERPSGATYRPTPQDQAHAYSEHFVAAEVTVSSGWDTLRVVTSEWKENIKDSHWSSGFDGDGTTDFLARDRSGILSMYPTSTQGGWQAPRAVGQGWSGMTSIFKTGDLDRDAKNDVVARDTEGRLFLYPGDGQGGWLQPRQIGTGWNVFNTIFSATSTNIDGGHSAIYGRDANGTLWQFASYSGGGLTYGGYPIGTGWNMFNTVFPAGDFNGDGVEDLMGRTPSGLLYSYQVDGSTIDQRQVIGVGWQVMARVGAAGDFNADGHQDVYGIDYSGRMHMYYGNGAGGWSGSSVVGWGWGNFTAVF